MSPDLPSSSPPLLPAVSARADRDGLARCLALSEAVCLQLQLDSDDAQAVRLAVEEACVNVVSHGYSGREPGLLALEFQLPDDRTLRAFIRDQATPFHPDQAPPPDLTAEVDDRPIGGLGWMLIRELMPPLSYTSGDEGNTLVLQRHLNRPVLGTAVAP